MIVEDLSAFFADFGLVAQFGGLRAPVLLDEPDHDVLAGRVTTTNYAMTFETATLPGLEHGSQVKIGTTNYSVININKQGDGALSIATLQRA